MDDEAILAMIQAVPEVRSIVLELVDQADEMPDLGEILIELAEQVSQLVDRLPGCAKQLQAYLKAVEIVANRADDGADLVSWCFFDTMDPTCLAGIDPWFGPATARIARLRSANEQGSSTPLL